MDMKEICKELVNEIDRRTLDVIGKMNKSLVEPDDINLRADAISVLAININANVSQIELLDQIIKDNKESSNISFYLKQRNLYWLKKIRKYYKTTNDELINMAIEHKFAMSRGEK